jgi:hypothetical protein
MAQRVIEIVIGRLLTDEDFRRTFAADPVTTLAAVFERGLGLNAIEIAALLDTDAGLWRRGSRAIDVRLQRTVKEMK